MRFLKICLKAGFCIFSFFIVLFFYVVLFMIFALVPSLRLRLTARLSQIFARWLIAIIGIRLKILGRQHVRDLPAGGYFFVSNHVSYVDGLVLGAVFPAIYASKSDLKKWPLVGALAEVSGTIFIERGRKQRLASTLAAMVGVLKNNVHILFFPEGTSSDGKALLPFQSAFFEAPVLARAPIIPVTVVYETVDGEPLDAKKKDSIYWYGEMTFADHFLKLLGHDFIGVRLVVHPPIHGGDEDGGRMRKRASELARKAIANGLHLFPAA